MYNFIHFKSTLRRPLRSTLLMLLIILLSFLFISRTVEYVIVNNEIETLSKYYRSIGVLSNNTPLDDDVSRGVELISDSSLIDFHDHRRITGATLHDIYNADNPAMSFDVGMRRNHNDAWLIGTVTREPFIDENKGAHGAYIIWLKVDEILAGYPEYAQIGESVRIFHLLNSPDEKLQSLDVLMTDDRVFMRTYYDSVVFNNFNPKNAYMSLRLKPFDADMLFMKLDYDEKLDFNLPENASLRKELEIVQLNQRAVALYTSKDMSAIPAVQEQTRNMYLTEGRWLNRDDDIEGRNVAVIHHSLAEIRGLSLGDTLSMTVRDFGNIPTWVGAIDTDELRESWQDFPTHEINLEIVGIHAYYIPQWALPVFGGIIHIPDSVMPLGFGGNIIRETEYSFVLKSSRDQDVFIDSYGEALQRLGITLSFTGVNADHFWTSVTPILESLRLNVLIVSILTLIGLLLVVFLYLLMVRKEFAIRRALGSPKRIVVVSAILPLSIIGLSGIVASGLFSWNYTLEKAAGVLAEIEQPDGIELFTSLSPVWLLGICAGLFLVLVIFMLGGTLFIAGHPVLELLQGVQAKRINERQKDTAAERYTGAQILAQDENNAGTRYRSEYGIAKSKSNLSFKYNSFIAYSRIVWRSIYRVPAKSFLVIFLTATVLLALGWMLLTIEHSEADVSEMVDNVNIQIDVVRKNPVFSGGYGSEGYGGFINQRTVDNIRFNVFISDYNLQTGTVLDFVAYIEDFDRNFDPYAPYSSFESYETQFRRINSVRFAGITSFDDFFAYIGRQNIEIDWATGWSGNVFFLINNVYRIYPVIFPAGLAEQSGLKPGDYIFTPFGNHETKLPGIAVIAGLYDDSNGFQEVLASIYVIEHMHERLDMTLYYTVANFTIDPLFNRDLDSVYEKIEGWVNSAGAGNQPLITIIRDSELRLAIAPLEQTIRLLSALLPVALIGFIFLTAGVSVLLLLQTTREAAYLRVLGATKFRVRFMLSIQQVFLGFVGLTVGLNGILFLFSSLTGATENTLLIYAGLFLTGISASAIFTAILITKRKPMELMQIKE